MPEVAHTLLPRWLGATDEVDLPTDLGVIKAELTSRGINNRGWRLYLDYGDSLFAPLGQHWLGAEHHLTRAANVVAYLRLLQACEMDVLPPIDLVASLSQWRLPDDLIEAIPPLFFRAAWKAAVANQYQESSPNEFISEVVCVAHWFFESGTNQIADTGLLKAGWLALLRRQKAWSSERESIGVPSALPTHDEWNPYIRRVEWGLYRFVALTNASQLQEEGEAMRHCVGTYADLCRSGMHRIFSVRERKSGQRIATLSLKLTDRGNGCPVWEVDQVSGLKNAEIVQQDLISAADAVVRAFMDLPASTFEIPLLPADEEMYCGI